MNKESYSLRVKNEKLVHYNRLGLFIMLIHFFYFILHLLRMAIAMDYAIPVTGILVSLGWILINRLVWKNNRIPFLPFWIGFGLLAILWFNLDYPWFASALMVLAVMDALARRKPDLVFNKDYVKLPFLFRPSVHWEDLKNVILKDGILTLDFKNDRLFQAELDESDGLVDEKEFNSFCSSVLTADKQS